MNRRNALKTASTAAAFGLVSPFKSYSAPLDKEFSFKLSLNTSTISGKKLSVEKYIQIAAEAGYECMELWVDDIKKYLAMGKSLQALKKLLDDSKIEVVNVIGFAQWMVDDEAVRMAGMEQMRAEMEMVSTLGCTRIAASAAGLKASPDLFLVGERYAKLLTLGKSTGVTPLLEFWGSSKFYHFGQALLAAAVANNTDVKILADVYHLHRGGSGFDCLQMVDGNVLEVFHMNDYPATIPRDQLEDKDRIYPGDGVAPLAQILKELRAMGGVKILSLELFNREYWNQDPLVVAKTGLAKMKKLITL